MGSIFGKAKRGFGKALKPRGPGVIRPKPTDRYGQQMKPKPIRPGKKDGGISGLGKKEKGLTLEKAKKSREKIQMDMFKKKRKEQSDKPKTPLGVKMKKGGFPDLSGDGKVTKKDILMGRGVIKRKK